MQFLVNVDKLAKFVIVAVSTIIFSAILGLSVSSFFSFFLWVVFVDLIGMGIIIASCLWLVIYCQPKHSNFSCVMTGITLLFRYSISKRGHNVHINYVGSACNYERNDYTELCGKNLILSVNHIAECLYFVIAGYLPTIFCAR